MSSALSLIQQAKGSEDKRSLIDVTPFGVQALSLTGASIVRFRLPGNDFLVGQDLIFNFNAEADGDAASDDVFMSNIACVYDSLRVRVDGAEIQHIREMGHLQCIDDNIRWTGGAYRASWGVICQGVPALSSSGTSVRYSMRLLHGTFLDRLIPCFNLGQIEVEFQLDTVAAKYTDATTAVTEVDITEMQLRCAYLESKELMAHYKANDVVEKFLDYDHHRNTDISSGNTSKTLIIPTSHKSLSGVVFQMRNQADVQDPNSGLELYQSACVTNALSKLSFVVDGVQTPRREINCDNQAEVFQALLEYGGHRRGNSDNAPDFFTAGYQTATDGTFTVAYPFNAIIGSESTVSGMNTASSTGQLEIHLSSMTASVDTQIDLWTRYERSVKFLRGGGYQLNK